MNTEWHDTDLQFPPMDLNFPKCSIKVLMANYGYKNSSNKSLEYITRAHLVFGETIYWIEDDYYAERHYPEVGKTHTYWTKIDLPDKLGEK
jgi:hypothetical protein